MSIKVMEAVWANSKQKGSALLLLLAIADHAHDDGGGAYPSIETLAKKVRMSTRNTQLLINKLEEARELEVLRGGGRNGTNLYTIRGVKTFQGGRKPFHRGGEKSRTEGVKPASPKPSYEPSRNRHKNPKPPSERASLARDLPPDSAKSSRSKAKTTPTTALTDSFDHNRIEQLLDDLVGREEPTPGKQKTSRFLMQHLRARHKRGETTDQLCAAIEDAASDSADRFELLHNLKNDSPLSEKLEAWMTPFVAVFVEGFEAKRAYRYWRTRRDDAALRELRDRDLGGLVLADEWPTAVRHYFESEFDGRRTLAHLASEFATFRLYPLDKYNQPVRVSPFSERGQANIEAGQRAADRIATRDRVKGIFESEARLVG